MRVPAGKINIAAQTRRIDVDNRMPLWYYYRIADNLLRQADIYREEKNIIDLYVILLRYTSLVSETIPCHQDYKLLCLIKKSNSRKKLHDAIKELEMLKPDVQREVDDVNKRHMVELDIQEKMVPSTLENGDSQASRKCTHGFVQEDLNRALHRQSYKLLPHPKEETLSRHSILGPNGLYGQWQLPVTGIRVQYPSNLDFTTVKISCLNNVGQEGLVTAKCGDSEAGMSAMNSVPSLDDGRWSLPKEKLLEAATSDVDISPAESIIIRQPTPPPILAQIEELDPVSSSKVAEPQPGLAVSSCCNGSDQPKTLQQLHLKKRIFSVTTLIVPKQESTSCTCQTTVEEEIFDVQDQQSLFPLGWIHTHPSQSCFMSSVDVHTHYSYQVMSEPDH